jgi:hypothetical protein
MKPKHAILARIQAQQRQGNGGTEYIEPWKMEYSPALVASWPRPMSVIYEITAPDPMN